MTRLRNCDRTAEAARGRKRQAQEAGGRDHAGERRSEGNLLKNMTTPVQRRTALAHLTDKGLSCRAACRWSGLPRHLWTYRPRLPERDEALVAQMKPVTVAQPRFG